MDWSLVVFSVVSHGQSALVNLLFDDFRRLKFNEVQIVLTLNLPEQVSKYNLHGLNVKILTNHQQRGFGENHNRALLGSNKKYFFIINPDIRLEQLDVPTLLSSFADPGVAAVGPRVINPLGSVDESARRFPVFLKLIKNNIFGSIEADYNITDHPMVVDWLAGMFVVYRGCSYKSIGGFDQRRFFMYYEDVDICQRLYKIGQFVMLDPRVSVIHNAQRASHRNIRHFTWHVSSALRYFLGV